MQLPVLGVLPRVARRRHGDGILVLDSPKSASAEAYRTLRTSLMFMAMEDSTTCIQFTSPTWGEGKTTVVTNLAAAFAQAGQRVILLDCDLRRPMVHEAFGLSNDRGFSSVLSGDCALADAVVNLEKEPFLAFLTAGPVPPNPSELLNSDRAKEILATLRENCDLLLIDSPPVLPVTDALVVSGHVDATLLVARTKRSTRRQVARADELLRQVKAPLRGVVFNGVKDASGGGYGYGYTGNSGGGPAGPVEPPPEGGGPSGPQGGGQPPSEGGGPSSDRGATQPARSTRQERPPGQVRARAGPPDDRSSEPRAHRDQVRPGQGRIKIGSPEQPPATPTRQRDLRSRATALSGLGGGGCPGHASASRSTSPTSSGASSPTAARARRSGGAGWSGDDRPSPGGSPGTVGPRWPGEDPHRRTARCPPATCCAPHLLGCWA